MQDFQTSIGSPSPSTLAAGITSTPLLHQTPIIVDDDVTAPAKPDGGAGGWRDKISWSTVFWCSGAIFGSVLQNVYLQETGVCLPNYPYFIFWSTVIPFNMIFFAALAGVYKFTKDITPEMRNISHKSYAVLGLLNMLNGVFLLFSNPHVPGAIQALLGPTIITIPLAMIACAIMLKHRYHWKHYMALCIILGGIFIAIYPSVFQPESGNGVRDGTAYWNSIWMIGSIPIVIAAVYEEKLFAEQPVHVLLMLAWITFYQMLFIFAGFWVDAIPNFGTADSVKDVFINQGQAFRCLTGHAVPECPKCDCDNASWNYVLFIVGYVLTNFFTIGVVKYCGALFSYVVSTIVTPLTTFTFSWKALLGKNAAPMNDYAYYALVVLMAGTITYRWAGDAIKPAHGHLSSTGDAKISLLSASNGSDTPDMAVNRGGGRRGDASSASNAMDNVVHAHAAPDYRGLPAE